MPPVAGSQVAPNMSSILSRVTRDQGPEKEQSLVFTPLTTQSTPTSLRTDRKIKWIDLHFRGRMTNPGGVPTFRSGPAILGGGSGAAIFSLIQQITVRGQHLRAGAQVLFQMRGEALAEYLALMMPNYVPQFTVTQNGGTPVRGGNFDTVAAHTNDIDFVLPIPLFPLDVSPVDQVFYCVHGPDWPGNLYVDLALADITAIASANPPAFTAFGSGAGSPSIDILTERPLVSKEFMRKIRPALTFHVEFNGQPTAAVTGVSGSGVKLSDLTVGKDTTRIFLKTGTAFAGTSAGVTVFGTLSDGIVTNTFISLDNRNLRFQGALGDSALQDYTARMFGRTQPIGYKLIDFIAATGNGPSNPKAAFTSSKLSAARKFELDGDVIAAANQLASVMQEMLYGRPALLA